MKTTVHVTAAMTIALILAHTASADDDDHAAWRPNNEAAASITGPILVERKSLEAGKTKMSLRFDSAATAFKPGQDKYPAHIYAVTRMSNPLFLNGRTLCGDTPPTWIVAVPQPPMGLELDVFTGVEKPTSPASPGLCNTFAYVR